MFLSFLFGFMLQAPTFSSFLTLTLTVLVFLLLQTHPINTVNIIMVAEAKETHDFMTMGGGLEPFLFPIEEEIHNLPDSNTWKHRPIYLAAGRNTRYTTSTSSTSTTTSTNNHDNHHHHHHHSSSSLPLGEPIPFETDLFKGKLLLRVQNIHNNVPKDHTEYFQGKKRLKHIVIQGQFKERLNMSDVWFGEVYEKPQKIPKFVARIILPFFQKLSPGIIMDLWSEKKHHKVLALMAAECRSLSIHHPGEEPNMTMHTLPEETGLLFSSFKEEEKEKRKVKVQPSTNDNLKRRKLFGNKKYASKFHYDPNLVYTFDFYDDIIDFVHVTVNMGKIMGKVSIQETMNGNPFSITAQTTDDREIFRFNIFHEHLVKYKEHLKKS